MASFLTNTKVELLKSRKTAAYWLTLMAGLFMPLMTLIMYVARPNSFIPGLQSDPWDKHLMKAWEPNGDFLLPMYVILVTSLVVQIEYRNNTWKQVYTSPRSYADIYFSKFFVVLLQILASFILFNLGMVLTAWLANLVHSGYGFFAAAVPWQKMFDIAGRMYMAVLGMTAIQYWLSLRLRNYIAPVGIGLVLVVTGIILLKWEHIHHYPYAYTILTYFNVRKASGIANHELYSLYWFAAVLLLGFWNIVKRKEHG